MKFSNLQRKILNKILIFSTVRVRFHRQTMTKTTCRHGKRNIKEKKKKEMQHKSSTDIKRWIPLDSFTWKGHNQISARHARGGDFAVVHTFEAFLFLGEGGIRSRAIMGLATASTLMETHGHSSNRIAGRIAYNVSWRNAWRVNFVNQSFSLTDLLFLNKFLITWICLFFLY